MNDSDREQKEMENPTPGEFRAIFDTCEKEHTGFYGWDKARYLVQDLYRIVTIQEAARLFGITEATIHTWCDEDKIVARQSIFGATWLISLPALEAYIIAHKNQKK